MRANKFQKKSIRKKIIFDGYFRGVGGVGLSLVGVIGFIVAGFGTSIITATSKTHAESKELVFVGTVILSKFYFQKIKIYI